MTLKQIQVQMAKALEKHGITAEITFCRTNMLSVFVEAPKQYADAKAVMAQVTALTFDSEDVEPGMGSVAFYTF